MTGSPPANPAISGKNIIPSPSMGEGEGGGAWIIRASPSPQSSPAEGEEVIFKVKHNFSSLFKSGNHIRKRSRPLGKRRGRQVEFGRGLLPRGFGDDKGGGLRDETKNERRVGPKQKAKLKAEDMMRIKILTFVFGIILIGCFAPPRPPMPRADLEGFRDIKWGTEISMLKDMEEVEQDKSSGRGVVWYRRKGDTLAIGEAKLKNIFYSFWKGEFESVWIDFEGEENLEALKKELFERFGKTREPEASMDKMGKRPPREQSPTELDGAFYVWWGKNTDFWLSYLNDHHKGTLTMNSKKISEERRDYEKEREREKRVKERRL